MREPRSLDKKILVATILLIILVLAVSLVNPAISKKSDNNGNNFPNNGVIKEVTGIEIYWDNKGTKRVSSIDWGSLEQGTNKTVTLFIKNKGKNPITLSHYTSNWQPSEIANYLNLAWDYTGQGIEFREIVQVVFTIYVSENVEARGTFDFDITIVGS